MTAERDGLREEIENLHTKLVAALGNVEVKMEAADGPASLCMRVLVSTARNMTLFLFISLCCQ